jgi:hypothetical protein
MPLRIGYKASAEQFGPRREDQERFLSTFQQQLMPQLRALLPSSPALALGRSHG